MFNFKNKTKIEEPTPLYIRLKGLYLACKEICEASYRNDAKANFFKLSSVWGLSVIFQSEQGELLIVPDCYEPIYNEGSVVYLSYYKIEDNNPKSLFHITAEEHSTEVKPLLGEKLSAKDISLAIYEFEQYIYKTLEKARATKARHISEVKKLEQGEIE